MARNRKNPRMRNKGKICKYPGCRFHASAKGYCVNHYHAHRGKEEDD